MSIFYKYVSLLRKNTKQLIMFILILLFVSYLPNTLIADEINTSQLDKIENETSDFGLILSFLLIWETDYNNKLLSINNHIISEALHLPIMNIEDKDVKISITEVWLYVPKQFSGVFNIDRKTESFKELLNQINTSMDSLQIDSYYSKKEYSNADLKDKISARVKIKVNLNKKEYIRYKRFYFEIEGDNLKVVKEDNFQKIKWKF